MQDPDLITALAMALNGVLYRRGRASAIRAWQTDGTFDFGHILSVELDLFQPWAHRWLTDRIARVGECYPSATIQIVDGV